jgi:octaprenyl-diphosphate synthase
MSSSIDQIKSPVSAELEAFELKFRHAMKSNVALLDTIMTYIVKRKGKQIRPLFVFLTAKACGGVTESTYRGASLVELLHTATLVHDDVVDDAYERRGFFSINALWKNKIAVLVGDYLLSKGLLLSLENDEFKILKIVSTAVREMSEGELLQIEKTRRLNITEEVYFDIIRKKTASLIASCCSVGAASAHGSDEIIEKMRLFGEKIGIAFQIKDDLLDYGADDIGKPKGIDIKEKKLTLPIIYTLSTTDEKIRKKIINTIKKDHDKKEKVNELIAFVNSHGGIEYTKKVMQSYIQEALACLTTIPDSHSKQALIQLVHYIIDRNK